MSSRFYTSRAEVSEHYDEIRYIQHADEHADPALELAAHERRDHGGGADHEAGRNIQQHALIFNGQGLALQKRTQRHNQRQIHDIRADDIADRQRGLLFSDRRDGRDKLRQRGADSYHGRCDHGVGNADHDSQCRAVIDKQLRAEDDGGSAEDELADVYRNALAVGARALVGRLASLLALCGKDALDHKADENEHDDNALGNRQRTVAREGKQQHDRRKQQTGLDAELLARHIAAHAHKRQAHDYDATAAAIREALVTKLGTIDLSDVKVQYKSAGQAVDLNYKPSTPVGTAFGEGEFTIVLTWGGDKGTAQYKPFSEEVTVKMVDNRIPSVVALVDVANITYNMDASKMIEEIIKNAIDSANSTLPADYKASDFTVKYYNADEDKWLPIGGLEKDIKAGILKDYPHINAGDGQKILVTYNGSKDYKPSAAVEGTLNVAKADVKVSMKLLTSVLAGQKVNKDVLKVTLNPDDPELDLYIVFVGFNTYKEKTIYVKLTEDQEKVIDFISDTQKGFPLYYKEEQTIRGKLNEGMTVDEFITYVDELMKNDTIKSALEKNGIDAEMLQNIVTALKSINKVTGDLRIAIGSPKHAGLYQAFAVAVNKNYNTGVGTGTVIVAMNAAGMKLEPNTELKKQTITVSEAEKYKKGEKAVATLTCDGDASDIDQSCIHYRFTGLSKIYSSHDFPTAPGKYIVTVSVRGGDYYALPTTFTFTVKAD